MIDSLLTTSRQPARGSRGRGSGSSPGRTSLVTLHRPALVDDDALLTATVAGLGGARRDRCRLSSRSTRERARGSTASGSSSSSRRPACTASTPLGYLDFLGLEAEARLVLDRLGRCAGGDIGARRPLLHAAATRRSARSPWSWGRTRLLGARPGGDCRPPAAAREPEARQVKSRSGTARRGRAPRRRSSRSSAPEPGTGQAARPGPAGRRPPAAHQCPHHGDHKPHPGQSPA